MSTQAPNVTFWVAVQHVCRASANLVDIIDQPGGVMKERHWGSLEKQVVVVGGASQKDGGTPDLVAYL